MPFEASAELLDALLAFIDATEPAAPDAARFRALMLERTAMEEAEELGT